MRSVCLPILCFIFSTLFHVLGEREDYLQDHIMFTSDFNHGEQSILIN